MQTVAQRRQPRAALPLTELGRALGALQGARAVPTVVGRLRRLHPQLGGVERAVLAGDVDELGRRGEQPGGRRLGAGGQRPLGGADEPL